MGTLIPTLTIKDSTTFSDEINFSVTDSLTTGTPSQGLTKVTITTADNQELVDDSTSGVFYFFAKNNDSTNFVILQTTASQQYARLSPGEWLFLPFCHHAGNVGVQFLVTTSANVQMEYAYWTKG